MRVVTPRSAAHRAALVLESRGASPLRFILHIPSEERDNAIRDRVLSLERGLSWWWRAAALVLNRAVCSEVVGRGQLGESTGPGPRDCAVAAQRPTASPLGPCGFVPVQLDSVLQLCKYSKN
ncbi:DCP2 [Cervus elaphus hippelaphus]|uniref:DCP2 n=1 Tax=Cervus elaphus hippelaphus TaxID=46360 RepID=A0A212CUP7_CEREH|nr:DCP2 [Cervus elaphus hippelaphus]